MLLLGCKPQNRNTEQHDVFFGIGRSLRDLLPSVYNFWPDAGQKIHLDAWREVNKVDSYLIRIKLREQEIINPGKTKLFFLNFGGYKKNEFEEFHYKMLVAGKDKGEQCK